MFPEGQGLCARRRWRSWTGPGSEVLLALQPCVVVQGEAQLFEQGALRIAEFGTAPLADAAGQ